MGVAGSSTSVPTFPPWLCQGPEITDELVRVLCRRLDEATLDVITVMLVRNCKLTPADVEVSSPPGTSILPRLSHRCWDSLGWNFRIQLCPLLPTLQFIQPPGSLPSEVLHLALPTSCRPWLPALAWYLRQNLLIFLHSPKYTDSNSRNHFQVRLHSFLSTLMCTPAACPTHTLTDSFLQIPLYVPLSLDLGIPVPPGDHYYPLVSSRAPMSTCTTFPTVGTHP